MPTPSEKKALLFLASIACLGGSVRVWRAHAESVPPTPQSRAALERQLQAVDSAKHASKPKKGKKTRRGFGVTPMTIDAGSGPLPGYPERAPLTADQGPDPSPRRSTRRGPRSVVDLDRADSASIDVLPGIGPTLAGRIVADRVANGPFGGIDALRTVHGVTAKLAAKLDSLVTFSGPQRPLNTVLRGGSAAGAGSVRPGKRRTP